MIFAPTQNNFLPNFKEQMCSVCTFITKGLWEYPHETIPDDVPRGRGDNERISINAKVIKVHTLNFRMFWPNFWGEALPEFLDLHYNIESVCDHVSKLLESLPLSGDTVCWLLGWFVRSFVTCHRQMTSLIFAKFDTD